MLLNKKRAKRRSARIAQRGLIRELGKQIFSGGGSGVLWTVVVGNKSNAAVVGVCAKRFEGRLLGHEVACGVEHEADADVEAAGAVCVRHVVAAARIGAEDCVEQGKRSLLGRTVLAFGPLVVCALT